MIGKGLHGYKKNELFHLVKMLLNKGIQQIYRKIFILYSLDGRFFGLGM